MIAIKFIPAVCLALAMCWQRPSAIQSDASTNKTGNLLVGADQLDLLLPMLEGKSVGLVVNHTALLHDGTHLADTLLAQKINVKKVLAPEHGFRGNADAGEHVSDSRDTRTGLPIVSLYGANRKPTPEQLADLDVVIFDIQDVGTRFFTYISTMHYVMEACAENNKKLIVLDRPNPNGGYVDGPVLEKELTSFVGMHPIPIVHGMTVGELAQMINGEGWLANSAKCDLAVVPVKNWAHKDFYSLPVKPSPNLPDDQAIRLYPSICLFEGTALSLGRGTLTPFEMIGHPSLKTFSFAFTPVSIDGMSKQPPLENQVCYGLDLRQVKVEPKVDLHYLIDMYKIFPDQPNFFNKGFNRLAGTVKLQEQIKAGWTEEKIRASWQPALDAFKTKRTHYLIYP